MFFLSKNKKCAMEMQRYCEFSKNLKITDVSKKRFREGGPTLLIQKNKLDSCKIHFFKNFERLPKNY